MTVQLPVPHDSTKPNEIPAFAGMTDENAGMTGQHKPIFSPQSQSKFLEHLSTNGNVRLACRAGGVSPQTAYRARRASPQFAALWDAALLSARSHAEDMLADRAINGWEEAVFYHGEEVATRRRYSDRLLLAHLARLDKLEERANIAANLAVLDEVIDALGRGEELPQTVPSKSVHPEPFDTRLRGCRQAQPEREGGQAQSERKSGRADERIFSGMDPVPSVPSCWEFPAGSCPNCGGDCGESFAEMTVEQCAELGERLAAMDCARPEGARPPHELAKDHPYIDAQAIEDIQLAAFEDGDEEWWLVVPTAEEWAEILAAAEGGEGDWGASGGDAIPLSRLGGEEY